MYEYNAEYIKNYDGDTITFMVDLGFDCFRKIRVRLMGVDTPEMRGGTTESKEAAKKAQKFVETELSLASMIVIKTDKDKSFDRYVAEVWYSTDEEPCDISLAQMLLNEGLAKVYEG